MSEGLDKPTTAAPWQTLRNQFLRTLVRVQASDGNWLSAVDAVAAFGAPLFVITAANPNSKRASNAENARRSAELRDALVAGGAQPRRAVGTSADGRWSEASWAVSGLGRKGARELGREFGQLAVFELTATELRVHGCASSWVETRPLTSETWEPALESDVDLAQAVADLLGIEVNTGKWSEGKEPGWVHEDGVGLDCRCGEHLELFGCERTAKRGGRYRAVALVCPNEQSVLFGRNATPAQKSVVKRRRTYLMARRDADRKRLSERAYWCYVIELADTAGPRSSPLPWLYVGQSALTPDERLAQHRAGIRASKWPRNHAVGLRADLYDQQPVLRSQEEARAYETWWAEVLAVRGWAIKGGH
nr:DUF3293 domain-containing protein [Rhabdothermincola salaria]